MIDDEKLQRAIKKSKKLIASAWRNDSKELISAIDHICKEVVLVVAEFKCQKLGCGKESDLQLHHLIMKPAREYMDFWRYITQRHYWANQIILCRNCHRDYHIEMGAFVHDEDRDSLCIPLEIINKIKKKYELKEE